MIVSILILIVLIIKLWKGQPRSDYERKDRKFINKNSERYNQANKPSKLYIWMQKAISKIPLPNSLKVKCQQLVRKEESSKNFTRTLKPNTEEKKLGLNLFFKSEKPK